MPSLCSIRFVCLTILLTCQTAVAQDRYDVVLSGGKIVDGTGAPWFYGDIGVRNGQITHIGRIEGSLAKRTIDVSGLIVCPGFIDMMGQTATPMLEKPESAFNLLTQGITTINTGEGGSAAPLDEDSAGDAGWQTMGEYFQVLEQTGIPLNVAQTVGHTQVRRIVLGDVDRRPTPAELQKMQALVREAMEAGAIGVSTALIYPPAVYATTEEIAALAEVAGEHGGRYYTHMRNEGDRLLEAIDEALQIGRLADAPVHIFHLKAAGRQNWGKMEQALARIKAARANGQQVAADIYPYINNGLGIAALIHPRHFAEGRAQLLQQLDNPDLRRKIRHEMENEGEWENWFRHIGYDWGNIVIGSVASEKYRPHHGRSLIEIANAVNEDPWTTFFELVKAKAFALPQSMSDANKIRAMQEEFVSFCTDVGPAGGASNASHPRAFGSFPRMLSHYVRDLGAISLERAIAQASAVAANEVLAYDRGRLAVGLAADIVAFDYENLADHATLASPHEPSAGVKYVLVNGKVVLDNGKQTSAKPGRVLRGPGYRTPEKREIPTVGATHGSLESFDQLMLDFVRKHNIPGAALAVTKDSRLVLARGYGHADKEAQQPATPNSLFRIASISKPITAVAILQLAEQGKMDLGDPAFPFLDAKPLLEKSTKPDSRLKKVTIRQLLQHTGGWDRSESFDPMFRAVDIAEALGIPSPANANHVIRYMLGKPLDFDPGTRYAYSNFGYAVLGRIIESVTGHSYEHYVRDHVLSPIGIHNMQIGHTLPAGRALPNEVKYYDGRTGPSVFHPHVGDNVPQPYGAWHLEAMDSHGGWIASSVDLARFAAAFDQPQDCPLLSRESVETMFRAPVDLYNDEKRQPDYFYACGWMIRPLTASDAFNCWHTGSLPGTATLLVRRHDGTNWAVLFNTRSGHGVSHLGRAVDSLVHQAADAVSEWPDYNLFDEYRKKTHE